MSKSSVPCKRAMRSFGLSWDGIRPKHGIILGRMSTGIGSSVGHGYAPVAAEARFAQPANLLVLQLFAVRSQLPFEPVAPSHKRSVGQGRSRRMSATGV